jgi:transcriptional regulator GlxA family with amidase domain
MVASDTSCEQFSPLPLGTSTAAVGRERAPRRILVIVFPGFSSFDVACIADAFHYANNLKKTDVERPEEYEVSLVSANGGVITSSSKMLFCSEAINDISAGDKIFIVGGEGAVAASRDDALICRLSSAIFAGVNVSPVSEGRLLVEAIVQHRPILRRSSTFHYETILALGMDRHSSTEKYLSERYPALAPALAIVQRDLGRASARTVGERIVPGAGRWLSEILGDVDDSHAARVRDAARWIEENCERAIRVRDVCGFASMTERTLVRHFQEVTGMTPAHYLRKARFDLACRLLVSTRLPVDKIARRCGFNSGVMLAREFQRRLSVSASEYRRRVCGDIDQPDLA